MMSSKLPTEMQDRMGRAMRAALAELGPDARGITLTVLWQGDRSTCAAAASEQEPDQHGIVVALLTRAPLLFGRWLQKLVGAPKRVECEASVVRS